MIDPQQVLARSTQLYSADEVDSAIADMAARISAAIAEQLPVVLAVMNGGAFTAVELCRNFRFPYQFDYVHATRYGQSLQGGELQWRVRPSAALAGRAVLLVDDILDRGTTLRVLQQELLSIGVMQLHTAVLVRKRLRDGAGRPDVDFHALETDDVFVFGCGMDYAGYWRGLPEIYACEPRQ